MDRSVLAASSRADSTSSSESLTGMPTRHLQLLESRVSYDEDDSAGTRAESRAACFRECRETLLEITFGVPVKACNQCNIIGRRYDRTKPVISGPRDCLSAMFG